MNYGTGDRLTAYDALSRVVTQVERVGGTPILTIVDAYDSAGRKISQLRDALLTSYTYDSADRLTGQQVAGAFATFTMDAVGNITVKSQQGSSPITMTYNAGSRLVTSVEGAVVSTYTFDANGNQTAVNAGGSRTTYAYDYENRMRTAIDPGGVRSTMAYWADGMRRFLEVGGTRTTFVWDGSDCLQSRTPSEVTTFSTVDAQILDSETGGSESLLVPDPLGSVVKVLDASGNQLYDAWYWAYGETRLSVGVNNTPWGYGGTWGYHFDMSRRLYIRARVLDPVTGRWYTVDPLWPNQPAFGYDLNPIIKIDFTGKHAITLAPGCDAGQTQVLKDGWDHLCSRFGNPGKLKSSGIDYGLAVNCATQRMPKKCSTYKAPDMKGLQQCLVNNCTVGFESLVSCGSNSGKCTKNRCGESECIPAISGFPMPIAICPGAWGPCKVTSHQLTQVASGPVAGLLMVFRVKVRPASRLKRKFFFTKYCIHADSAKQRMTRKTVVWKSLPKRSLVVLLNRWCLNERFIGEHHWFVVKRVHDSQDDSRRIL